MKSQAVVVFEHGAGETSLTLELDPERNAGASAFAPGAEVWVRAITDRPIAEKGSTRGSFQVSAADLRFEHEEDLVFSASKQASLGYPIYELLSATWLGRGLGQVTVSGRTATAAREGYGILRLRYRVAYSLMRLSGVSDEGPTLVWARDDADREGSLQIPFSMEGEEEPVYAVVKNYCTGLPIASAQVWVDGQYRGETDQFGRIYLGMMKRGTQHDIRVTAVGFKSSDADALANDYFIVQ